MHVSHLWQVDMIIVTLSQEQKEIPVDVQMLDEPVHSRSSINMHGEKYLPVISARLFKPETLVGFQQSFQCFQLLFFLEVVLIEISVKRDSLKVF